MDDLSSTFKDDLATLINDHYTNTVSFLEVWSDPDASEASDPSYRKLTVTMTLLVGGKSATFFAVVPDESQENVDVAYTRFLRAMTSLLTSGRVDPFTA